MTSSWSLILQLSEAVLKPRSFAVKHGEGFFILCFVERAPVYRARHRQSLRQSLCPVSAGRILKYEIFTLSSVFIFFQVQGEQVYDVIWSSLNENCVFLL